MQTDNMNIHQNYQIDVCFKNHTPTLHFRIQQNHDFTLAEEVRLSETICS